MKVCVIGAGISGLSCIHELTEKGIAFDCFEKRNALGGLWNYSDNDNSVYKNCKQNHPRSSMQINNQPISNSTSDYLSHSEYLAYLTQFDSPHIHYGRTVESAIYDSANHHWQVRVNGEATNYSHLIVCSGHYAAAKTPLIYQKFTGKLIHSRHYKIPDEFSGQRVLVVGGGSSGIQIASDLAGIASDVSLSIRSMPFILPRYVDNQTLLEFYRSVKHLPENLIIDLLQQKGIDQTLFNIPKAEQGLLTGSTIPICDEIFPYAKANKIRFLKSANEIHDNKIQFESETLTFDAVILATGFQLAFPFLNFDVDYRDNTDFLINKKFPNLYFVGMLQPVGPVPPLLQAQAKLLAMLVENTAHINPLPTIPENKSHRVLLADYIQHLTNKYAPAL